MEQIFQNFQGKVAKTTSQSRTFVNCSSRIIHKLISYLSEVLSVTQSTVNLLNGYERLALLIVMQQARPDSVPIIQRL